MIKKLVLILVLLLGGCQIQERRPHYKSGDIVMLKSGGPKMTVIYDIYDDGIVYVQWIDNLGQPQRCSYYQSQIERF